jgi:hypothetical protein
MRHERAARNHPATSQRASRERRAVAPGVLAPGNPLGGGSGVLPTDPSRQEAAWDAGRPGDYGFQPVRLAPIRAREGRPGSDRTKRRNLRAARCQRGQCLGADAASPHPREPSHLGVHPQAQAWLFERVDQARTTLDAGVGRPAGAAARADLDRSDARRPLTASLRRTLSRPKWQALTSLRARPIEWPERSAKKTRAAEYFFALGQEDRREAREYGRAETARLAHLLEKDAWVAWTLSTLFESAAADCEPPARRNLTALRCLTPPDVVERFGPDRVPTLEREEHGRPLRRPRTTDRTFVG